MPPHAMPAPDRRRRRGTRGGASAPAPGDAGGGAAASAPAPGDAGGGAAASAPAPGDAGGGAAAPASVLKAVTFNVGLTTPEQYHREQWSDISDALQLHDIIFFQEIGAWPGYPKDCCISAPACITCPTVPTSMLRKHVQ